mmetsp:Transcript_125469/g.313459  ORF Transcript_125469/g.313459 Transcript_125469/m.313459 type:complete len:572 (+) Transcript_125469:3-1718(+)
MMSSATHYDLLWHLCRASARRAFHCLCRALSKVFLPGAAPSQPPLGFPPEPLGLLPQSAGGLGTPASRDPGLLGHPQRPVGGLGTRPSQLPGMKSCLPRALAAPIATPLGPALGALHPALGALLCPSQFPGAAPGLELCTPGTVLGTARSRDPRLPDPLPRPVGSSGATPRLDPRLFGRLRSSPGAPPGFALGTHGFAQGTVRAALGAPFCPGKSPKVLPGLALGAPHGLLPSTSGFLRASAGVLGTPQSRKPLLPRLPPSPHGALPGLALLGAPPCLAFGTVSPALSPLRCLCRSPSASLRLACPAPSPALATPQSLHPGPLGPPEGFKDRRQGSTDSAGTLTGHFQRPPGLLPSLPGALLGGGIGGRDVARGRDVAGGRGFVGGGSVALIGAGGGSVAGILADALFGAQPRLELGIHQAFGAPGFLGEAPSTAPKLAPGALRGHAPEQPGLHPRPTGSQGAEPSRHQSPFGFHPRPHGTPSGPAPGPPHLILGTFHPELGTPLCLGAKLDQARGETGSALSEPDPLLGASPADTSAASPEHLPTDTSRHDGLAACSSRHFGVLDVQGTG